MAVLLEEKNIFTSNNKISHTYYGARLRNLFSTEVSSEAAMKDS